MKSRLHNLASFLVISSLFLGNAQSESFCDDNSKLKYVVGKSYVYDAELVSYAETKREHDFRRNSHHPAGKLVNKGQAVLTALENCEYVLTLTNFQGDLLGERKSSVSGGGTDYPRTSLKFTFRNGEVSNLLKDSTSQPWATNMVRAVLSMIQNKALANSEGDPTEKETSILGDCMVRYYIPQENTFTKKIHTERCANSVYSAAGAEGVPYESAPYASIMGPRMEGTVRCTQSVEDGILKNVSCSEADRGSIMFPSARDTLTKLTFKKSDDPPQAGGATTEEISQLSVPTSFLFDSARNIPDDSWDENNHNTISKLIASVHADPDTNNAEIYAELRDKFRYVKDLEQFEGKLASTTSDSMQLQFQKNMVRDVATEIGTEASVVYMAELIDRDEIDYGGVLTFYLKLPFTQEPTEKGVAALVGNLNIAWESYQNTTMMNLDSQKRLRRLLLGVSGYGHQFCKHSKTDCGAVPAYQQLVNGIAQFTESKNPATVPATMHALGNLDKLTPEAVEKIKAVMTSDGLLEGWRRFTALEAFRRDPCQPELKKTAREMLTNAELSMELRAEAYLAVARCAQEDDLKVIDSILQDHESPLSGFIASHVHNIMDSQSPSKQFLKESPLAQIGIPEKVHPVYNKRGFSKYLEFSTFAPGSNIGFSSEGHVHFADDNPVPHFVAFNVTVDVFGKSYNIFEIGLSRRMVGPLANMFVNRELSYGKQLATSFFALDSYCRRFGTTISMGLDAIDMFSAHQFMERTENPETGEISLRMAQPFTVLDKEFVLPTIAGLPLTISTEAAIMPMISMNHSGDPTASGLSDLFSSWDPTATSFKHSILHDSTFFFKTQVSTGKGTPTVMSESMQVKVHSNHSISYESIKNGTGSKWDKRIEFPNKVVWSKKFEANRMFALELNGKQLERWSINRDSTSPRMEPKVLFSHEAIGLRFSAKRLSQPAEFHEGPLTWDGILMVEKMEDSFTGYNLESSFGAAEDDDNRRFFKMLLTANGLSTQDSARIAVDFTDVSSQELESDTDRPKLNLVFMANISRTGFARAVRFHYNSEGLPKSKLNLMSPTPEFENPGVFFGPSLGLISRPTYDMKLEVYPGHKWHQVFSCKIVSKDREGDFNLILGPPDHHLGIAKVSFSMPQQSPDASQPYGILPDMTFKADIGHNCRHLGKFGLVSEFTAAKGDISTFTKVTHNDHFYELKQTLPKPTEKTKGENDQGPPLHSLSGVKYTADYKDSHRQTINVEAAYNHQRDSPDKDHTTVNKKASLHIKSWNMKTPIVAEASFTRELDHSKKLPYETTHKLFHTHVEAHGKKWFEIKRDKTYSTTVMEPSQASSCTGRLRPFYTEEGNKELCITKKGSTSIHIPHHFELDTKFSNVEPEHNLEVKAHIVKLQARANYKSVTRFPGNTINHLTDMTVENVPVHGEKWHYSANSTYNKDERSLYIFSNTSQIAPKLESYVTTLTGSLASDVTNGESKFNINIKMPKKTLYVDVTNVAQRSDALFNNTLVAVVDDVGLTRIAKPKHQLTWKYFVDQTVTDNAYSVVVQTMSDMKLEKMVQPPTEAVFHCQKHASLKKYRDVGKYVLDGQGTLAVNGKEKGAHDFALELFETLSGPPHVEENTNAIAPVEGSQKGPQLEYKSNFNGWLELTGVDGADRNHTLTSKRAFSFYPRETRVEDAVYVSYKTVNVDQKNVEKSVTIDLKRQLMFHSITDFVDRSNFQLGTNNKTYCSDFDLTVKGPEVRFLMENNNGEEDSKWVIDLGAGIYEEKHQHKFNVRSRTGSKRLHSILPTTDFNVTISRRR